VRTPAAGGAHRLSRGRTRSLEEPARSPAAALEQPGPLSRSGTTRLGRARPGLGQSAPLRVCHAVLPRGAPRIPTNSHDRSAKNSDHTREWLGFLPWTITESYDRLKSAFSYLRAYETGGAPRTRWPRAGQHRLPDGCDGPLRRRRLAAAARHGAPQRLVGDNPHGYTRDPKFHAWIDGGFIAQAGIRFAALAPRAGRRGYWPPRPRRASATPCLPRSCDTW